MHKLNFSKQHPANVAHVNHGKDRYGDDEEINRLDVKLTIPVERDKVAELFVEPGATQQALWDDAGQVRDDEYALDLSSRHEDQIFTIKATRGSRRTFNPATVKLKKAKPAAGAQLKITATVSFHPDVADIGPICDMLHQDVKITITNNQKDISDSE